MSYQKSHDDLPLYADGELNPAQAAELEAALADSAELRAELDRWRDLRHCANRVLTSPAAPAHLRDTIHAALYAGRDSRRSFRVFKLFGGFTAIAAAIAVVVFLWQPRSTSASPRIVGAERFVAVYEKCAVKNRHCQIPVDTRDIAQTHAKLVGLQETPVLLPDLASRGFELHGVCRCFGMSGVRVIHAHYGREGQNPAIVSFFSIDTPLRLKACGKAECCSQARDGYETADSGGVWVYKWQEANSCYAVCGGLEPSELQELADVVRVAHRMPVTGPLLAAAW